MTDALTLDALFRILPERFTAARNQLVAELRRAGKGPAATALAKLPRPTPVVWAINQVTHGDRAAVERLLATADQLKAAQLGRASTDVPASSKAYQEAVLLKGFAHRTKRDSAFVYLFRQGDPPREVNILTVPSVIRARRFVAVDAQPKYLTVYEFDRSDVPDSEAWSRVRESTSWSRRIRPQMRLNRGSPAVFRRLRPDPVP